MKPVGTIESLWRYPVKSMAGESLPVAFIDYGGVYGDRMYAVLNPGGPPGFPYLTARERGGMLLHRPRFRDPVVASMPPNHAEALTLAGITPVYPDLAELAVEVQTPSGQTLPIDDPALLASLTGDRPLPGLSVIRSHRAMTDCRPLSLISLETIQQLGREVGIPLDMRRFRANLYARLDTAQGYGEDSFVGRRLQIGQRAVVAVLDRDPRCNMIAIDPDTAEQAPAIMRNVARNHDGNAGVYCAAIIEGAVKAGDPIVLLE
jgi:hypothetical protein